jgi:hypothetical protein
MSDESSVEARLKRYEQAKKERELKIGKLTQAYRMAFPTNSKWLVQGEGDFSRDKTDYRWDTTAISGLQSFSSGIQSIIMPAFSQWAKFVPSAMLPKEDIKQLQDALIQPTNVLFRALEASNLMLQAGISMQDMGISVGLMQVKSTGNLRAPLRFKSIPMHNVSLGEYDGDIHDVYRKFKLPARDIEPTWPDAKLTERVSNAVKNSPHEDIELLEGTIYDPSKDEGKRYTYFVMDVESKKDLVHKEQSNSRWIPFRYAVSPGEVWGDGPVLQIIDKIRMANKTTQMDFVNAGLKISSPLFVNKNSIVNPNNLRIEAGAIIHVNDTSPGQLPIVPLDIAKDFRFDQVVLQQMQAEIRDALFEDPLGPVNRVNQSATETSIRQQNWIKKSSASFGRLSQEFSLPIILKSSLALQEQGLMPPGFHIDESSLEITMGGLPVDVQFESAIAKIDDNKQAEQFLEYNIKMQSIFGPQQSMSALNAEQVPAYLAEKLGIDSQLIKGPIEIEQMMQQQAQAQQAQQQAQAQQDQQASQSAPPQQTQEKQQTPELNIGQ